MKRKLTYLLLLCCLSITAGAVSPSGTLPIVYVNTGGTPVADKVNYVQGTIYIDNLGLPGYEALGTAAQPLQTGIRGRGNWTWTGFDKKPYKIKLAESSPVLGMPKSKHWVLMAAADDNLGFLRNTVGFLLSQHLHLRWTPHQVPVELVLNGDYQGLYFLTETIRIQKNRIAIGEQPDNNTDAATLRGGWLLEIDNYEEEGQVRLYEDNGQHVKITVKTPDSLSTAQRTYLEQEMNALNAAIYADTWDSLVDLDELARFYLVQEIIENTESFHGSCYFYRDTLPAAKWLFGPVWDFGNSYWRHRELFIYEEPSFAQYWIGRMAELPAFQTRVHELWWTFLRNDYPALEAEIRAFTELVSEAAKKDANRWQNHGNVRTNRNMEQARQEFMGNLTWRVNWLRTQWGENNAREAVPAEPKAVKRLVDGQLVIERDGKTYTLTGQTLRQTKP